MFDMYGAPYYNGYSEYGQMAENEAIGVYTPSTQINIDEQQMMSLGFSSEEINTLKYIVMCSGQVSTSKLTMYGMSYEEARKIKYMYDIVTGKVNIESTDDLSKHLRKLFGSHHRIGIGDLALSKLQKVPRMAVVAGIKDPTYSILNSSQYPINERIYNVVDVTGGRIHIETNRKPVLKYKQSKKIDGVLEIIDTKPNGNIIVAVDKNYARLVNRYIIVGSLKRPEFHHGLIEIVCIEGTRVYIYAQTLGTKEAVRYNGGAQRVYQYGFMPNEISAKVMQVASEMYPILCGVYATNYASNSDFIILPPEEKQESIDDIIEE